jgi:hypothetical protein
MEFAAAAALIDKRPAIGGPAGNNGLEGLDVVFGHSMLMKGKKHKGYCYVSPDGIQSENDFEYWITLCLSFNNKAKSSKK